MGTTKYIEALWMYLIGIGFISVGFYMILFLSASSPLYPPMGFILMVFGLLFSTLGGFYGRKKLLESSQPKPMEQRQIDQIKQNVVSQLKPPETPKEPSPSPPKIEQSQQKVEEPKPPESTDKVVKVMVCPGCNTENPPSNMFCFNCGKRLRAPAKKPKTKRKAKKT
ncbi:MAG: hypothetical protein QXN71_04080 [Candidatus Aenigmatarchaeota archaeon]